MGTSTNFPDDINDLGEDIANLTLLKTRQLMGYLMQTHHIKLDIIVETPQYFPPGHNDITPPDIRFDIILKSYGYKKMDVLKLVRLITGYSIMDTKRFIEAVPVTIKGQVPEYEAKQIKNDLERVGATVSLIECTHNEY